MDTTFWKKRWEDGNTGWHNESINEYLTSHWPRLHLSKNASILVPLCGKSLDLNWLENQGHHVTGIEVSTIACEKIVKGRMTSTIVQEKYTLFNSDRLKLFNGDFFNSSPKNIGTFDAVWDRAALVALSPNIRHKYVNHLASLLNPSAQILLDAFWYPKGEKDGPPFSVDQNDVHTLFDDLFDIKLLENKRVYEESNRYKEQGLSDAREMIYLLKKSD